MIEINYSGHAHCDTFELSVNGGDPETHQGNGKLHSNIELPTGINVLKLRMVSGGLGWT